MNEPRILIVEDERIVATDLSKRLKAMGYEPVGRAASGEQAIALAGELKPDLVLMDIRLEGEMDGIAAAQEIRQRFHIPAVFLSAHSDETTLKRAKLAEPFGYLIKPFEDRELRATIEMARYKHGAEDALRKSAAHLQFALETTETGAWELDLLNYSATLTLTHARIFGYQTPPPTWSYEQFLEHVTPEDRPEVDRTFRQAIATQADFRFDCRIRRRDGQVRWIWVRGGLERDPAGKATHMSGLVRDITERKQLEARAQRAQKMEAMSHLTGGVAHEFNNIVATIMMGLGLAKTTGPLGEDPELLGAMEGSCERAAGLVRQLLAASRQSLLCRQSLDLAATVARQLEALRPQLGEGIKVKFTSSPSLGRITADGALLEQVFRDLCLNAREAMRSGGVLRVDLREEEVGPEREESQLDARAGRFVRLTVSDTGCGMDDEIRQRLFEPFFTTKDVVPGAGLSLAAAQGIVRQHQGWVEVESQVGQGSTFRVYLPVEVPTEGAVVKTSPAKSGAGANGTILLVEDEESLRKLTGKFLTRLGYPVLEAADGAAALAVWAAHAAEIGLIFTDMELPGELSGLDVARQAMARKPGLKAIITSGYYTEKVDLEEARTTGILYAPQPCSFTALTAAVRSFLGDGVAAPSQPKAANI